MSSSLKDIPVVIISSENVPAMINRVDFNDNLEIMIGGDLMPYRKRLAICIFLCASIISIPSNNNIVCLAGLREKYVKSC